MAFDPIIARDNSRAIRQQNQLENQNIKAQAAASATQAQIDGMFRQINQQQARNDLQNQSALDNINLQTAQSQEKIGLANQHAEENFGFAQQMRDFQVGQAKQKATMGAINGLLSLTKTGMQFAADLSAQRKKEREKRQVQDEMLNFVGLGPNPAPAGFGQEAADLDTVVGLEANAINEVAGDLNDGTIGGASLAQQLVSQSSLTSLRGIDGNVYAAKARYKGFIASALANLPAAAKPKTEGEAAALMNTLNREFVTHAGLGNTDPARIASVLGETMVNQTSQQIATLASAGIKESQAFAQADIQNMTNNMVKGGLRGQALWDKVSKQMAHGGAGFNGYSRASNDKAMQTIIAAAVQNKDMRVLDSIEGALQNGNKGTELGKTYGAQLDKARDQIRQAKVQEHGLMEREQQMQVDLISDSLAQGRPRDEVIQQLLGIGTAEARTAAQKLMNKGLNYDPDKQYELLEMERKGTLPGRTELKELLDTGVIDQQTFTRFARSDQDEQLQKDIDAKVRAQSSYIMSQLQGSTQLPPAVQRQMRAQFNNRGSLMKEDLKNMLFAELRSNPDLIKDGKEMQRMIVEKTNELLQRPMYQLNYDIKNGASWGADVFTDKNLSAFTLSPGEQDFSSFTVGQIFNDMKVPTSEMNPSVDRFMTSDQLKEDVKSYLANGSISNRTTQLADRLGLNPSALLDAQLGMYELPSLNLIRKNAKQQAAMPPSGGSDIRNEQEGFIALKSMGFPTRGAAYLASAINHESAWNGTREWGQVAGDGTSRNGGLISWAQWANDPARLGAIERHFGPEISNIPESEQLEYMRKEMREDYPESFRIFNNPNASSADLQWAVWNYWRFDRRFTSTRWSDAERLIARN